MKDQENPKKTVKMTVDSTRNSHGGNGKQETPESVSRFSLSECFELRVSIPTVSVHAKPCLPSVSSVITPGYSNRLGQTMNRG